MRGLVYQIQRVSDTAKGLAVRVGGIENVVWEDNETTFPDMQERIKKTIDFLEGVDPKSIEGKEDAEVVMKTQCMFWNIFFLIQVSPDQYYTFNLG